MRRRQHRDRPPTRRPRPARRLREPGCAALLVLCLGLLLAPGGARGDCVQNGNDVTCSPGGTGGFDAAGQDNLDVTVQADALVSVSVPDARGITIANNSTLTIEAGAAEPPPQDGTIEISADGAVGIWGGDGNEIVNLGTISGIGAGARGIVLGARDNDVFWSVENLGEITLEGDSTVGITVGDDSWVANRGELSLTGNSAVGISAAVGGQGHNYGVMTLTGDSVVGMSVGAGGTATTTGWSRITVEGSSAIGIQIESAQRVENLGRIEANGTNGVGVLATGTESFVRNYYGTIEATGAGGIGVALGRGGGGASRLQNFGAIVGSSVSGPAVSFEGSVPTGDPEVPNELDNRGSITAEGGTAVLGSDAVEFVFNYGSITGRMDLGDGNDRIEHYGTITGDIDFGSGDDTFASSGVLTGEADLGAGDDGFHNLGSVEGDVILGPGEDRYFLYAVGSITGVVQGGDDTDTFVLTGSTSDAFDLSNPPVATTGFEALQVNTNATWTLSGSGAYPQGTTVTQGTLALDGDVSLEGSYTQGAGTTLAVHIEGGSHGNLTVTGTDSTITIDPGATLAVTTGGQVEWGLPYVILEVGGASGSLAGTFDTLDYPSAVVGVQQGSDATSLWLWFTRLASYADLASTPNRAAVGGYLDPMVDDPSVGLTPELDPLVATLDALSSDSDEFNAALSQLSPEAYDAHTSAALSWGRSVSSVFRRRPLRCESRVYEGLPDVRSESPCGERGWMPWAEPIGQYAKRDGGSLYVSYDRLGAGLVAGADRRISERWTVSAGLAVGRIGIDYGGLGNGTLTTFDLAAAGSLLLGPAHVRAVASYGHGWHTTRRDLDFLGVRFTGDHDSNRLGLLVEAGYELRLGWLRVEPLLELDYSYIAETGVSEDAGAEALRVDERSSSQVATAAGLRLSGTYYKYAYLGQWLEWLDGVITPELSARWRRVWTGDDRDVKARMVGASAAAGRFEVAADDASAGLEFAARVIFQPQWTRNTVELAYDVFAGNSTTVHNLGAKLRIPF